MSNPNKTTRTVLRWTHLLTGFLVGVFVYTPAHDNEAFVLLMQAAVLPAVTLTGSRMRQQARIGRSYRRPRSSRPGNANAPRSTDETRRSSDPYLT